MPRITAERREDRYQSILEAATAVFAEKGLDRASMSDVARCADVSDGLLYRYFANKRALLDAVLREFYERLLHRLETEVFRFGTFDERLRKLVELHLTTFVQDAGLCRLFISEVRVASNYRGSATQTLNRRYTKVLLKVTNAAIKERLLRTDFDPTLFRDLLFGGIEHLAWRHVNGGRRLNVTVDAGVICGVLLDGIKIRHGA
jgi:AcrR family transcriptional regulator